MQTYWQIQFYSFLHGCNKNMFIHNRNTIICKSCCSCICKCFHIYKLCSIKFLRNSSCLHNMNSRCFTFFLNIPKSLYIIYNWLCISHTYNSCKTSSGRCRCTCDNIFLIGKTRIPEMHMSIHKTWSYNHAICINNLNVIRFFRIEISCINVMTDFFNNIILNKNINNLIKHIKKQFVRIWV